MTSGPARVFSREQNCSQSNGVLNEWEQNLKGFFDIFFFFRWRRIFAPPKRIILRSILRIVEPLKSIIFIFILYFYCIKLLKKDLSEGFVKNSHKRIGCLCHWWTVCRKFVFKTFGRQNFTDGEVHCDGLLDCFTFSPGVWGWGRMQPSSCRLRVEGGD